MVSERADSTSSSSSLLRGVLGGGCARPGKANLRLICRAINGDWDIPEDKRRALLRHLIGVAESAAASRRSRNLLAAALCLVAADRANLREQRREQEQEHWADVRTRE